jgi:hypothetical protein
MATPRFTPKKAQGLKFAYYENGKKIKSMYYMSDPKTWSVFDNERDSFVIISIGDRAENNILEMYDRKYVVQDICNQFNELGATCGNDNLQLVELF